MTRASRGGLAAPGIPLVLRVAIIVGRKSAYIAPRSVRGGGWGGGRGGEIHIAPDVIVESAATATVFGAAHGHSFAFVAAIPMVRTDGRSARDVRWGARSILTAAA